METVEAQTKSKGDGMTSDTPLPRGSRAPNSHGGDNSAGAGVPSAGVGPYAGPRTRRSSRDIRFLMNETGYYESPAVMGATVEAIWRELGK